MRREAALTVAHPAVRAPLSELLVLALALAGDHEAQVRANAGRALALLPNPKQPLAPVAIRRLLSDEIRPLRGRRAFWRDDLATRGRALFSNPRHQRRSKSNCQSWCESLVTRCAKPFQVVVRVARCESVLRRSNLCKSISRHASVKVSEYSAILSMYAAGVSART